MKKPEQNTKKKKSKNYGVGGQERTGSWERAGYMMSSSLNCFIYLLSPLWDAFLYSPAAALTFSP